MKEEMTISDSLHPSGQTVYCTVILPLALDKLYTYIIPQDLVTQVATGMRVEVQFGKKSGMLPLFSKLTT